MQYSEFLDFISNGCSLIFNTLIQVANNLMSNYFFITILGISIFSSLLWFFLDNVVYRPVDNVRDNCEDFIHSKRKYNLFHEVRYNFLQTNEKDVYLSRMANLKLNRNVFDNYLSENKDLEFSIRFKQLNTSNEVYRAIKSTNNNDEKIFKHWNDEILANQNDVKTADPEIQKILANF